MLKNSRYFIISAFFMFVFFLFLMFNPDSYNVESVSDVPLVIKNMNTSSTVQGQIEEGEQLEIAVIADDFSDSNSLEYISLTLSFLHQDYIVYDSLYDIGDVDTVIITTPNIKDSEVTLLSSFLSDGRRVIFTVLPEPLEDGLMKLLGITKYLKDYEVLGYDIYEGILLGGMLRFEELSLQCAKVALSGGCKVYSNGNDKNRDKDDLLIDQEMKNPLIWRTYYESGVIFAMNAPFLSDASGMGILTGILSLASEDFIYPIIGTSNVILDNFPYIGNDDALIGDRSYHAFTRDIIWPDLASITNHFGITLTCYTNGQFANSKNAYDTLKYVNNELYKEKKGEIGYNAAYYHDSVIYRKDMQFLKDKFSSHIFRSYNGSDISLYASDYGITSILTTKWNKALNWINEQALMLPIISEGLGDEYTNLMFSSMASTLGLIMHKVDMEPVFSGEIAWNRYSLDISKYFSYLLQKYTFITSSNVRTTAEAAKDYLNLKMDVTKNEQEMIVTMQNNISEISFLLRTSKKIDVKNCVNCSISQVEDNVYLVKSAGDQLVIKFSDTKETY